MPLVSIKALLGILGRTFIDWLDRRWAYALLAFWDAPLPGPSPLIGERVGVRPRQKPPDAHQAETDEDNETANLVSIGGWGRGRGRYSSKECLHFGGGKLQPFG